MDNLSQSIQLYENKINPPYQQIFIIVSDVRYFVNMSPVLFVCVKKTLARLIWENLEHKSLELKDLIDIQNYNIALEEKLHFFQFCQRKFYAYFYFHNVNITFSQPYR